MAPKEKYKEPQEPKEIHGKLIKSSEFKIWKQEHPQSFLSHIFSRVVFSDKVPDNVSDKVPDKSLPFEIGYYDPLEKKITTFIQQEKKNKQGEERNNFIFQPPQEVFQEKENAVEQLYLKKIKISLHHAQQKFVKESTKQFPQVTVQQGFIILQCLQGNTLWNISGITSAFSVVNVKIHAETGDLLGIQQIEVVRKEKGEAVRKEKGQTETSNLL